MASGPPRAEDQGDSHGEGCPGAPATPPEAGTFFGDRLGIAERYVALLADTGITHGLIGPREGPRLWSRHVLNSAVVAQLLPQQGPDRLIDVGTGAGLPGIPLAIMRPDVQVHLVDPLTRRTDWLRSCVSQLGLDNVVVHDARAEDLWGVLDAPVVTARAVSTLENLAVWCLPLVRTPGCLLALKGSKAAQELSAAQRRLDVLGVGQASLVELGEDLIGEPTRVVRLDVDEPVDIDRLRRRPATSAGSARRRTDRSTRAGTDAESADAARQAPPRRGRDTGRRRA